MALLDDVIAALGTASTTAQTKKTNTQTQATAATTTADTTGGSCAEGFTALAIARSSAAQAHDEAGKATVLLATLNLATLIPPPTAAQLAAATTQKDAAVQAAIDADAAIAAAELLVRARYLTCVTQFVVDHVKSCATNALAAATTADAQADTLAANSETAPLSTALNPQLHVSCAEGLVIWKQGEDQIRSLHSLNGQAQSCVDVMNAGIATGVFPMSPADIAAVVANAGLVGTKLADAQANEDAALPIVLQAHDACVVAASAVQPLIDCVTGGLATANAATKNLTDALAGGGAANLDVLAQRLIDQGGAASVTRGANCNEGVAFLAHAATLIADQTAAANLPHLLECVNELAAAASTNALVSTGRDALDVTKPNSPARIIEQATALLDPNNPATHLIWKNRFVCTVRRGGINIHVTDESGDDFGGGANVSVINFPLSSFLPVDLPVLPPVGTTNGAGRVSIEVPLAPEALPLPPGTPPGPGDLPTTDAATLVFEVTRADRASGHTAIPIDHHGLTFEVQIPIADTSI